MGGSAVLSVLEVLSAGLDEFKTVAVVADGRKAAIVPRIRAGEAEVTGVDDMIIDADGLVAGMSIQWRPLASVVAIQRKPALVSRLHPVRSFASNRSVAPPGSTSRRVRTAVAG